MVDSAQLQDRKAVTDPDETVELLGIRDESVPEAIRETIRYCLAQEAA